MQKLFLLFISLLAQFFGFQNNATAQASKTESKQANPNSLLWKISGKDLTKPSYILGTMHAICAEDYFFNEEMERAFSGIESLVLEVDLSDPNMAAQVQEQLVLPKDKKFSDYFNSEDEFLAFSAQLQRVKEIDIEQYKQFKPFILISALAMKEFTCPATVSYEMNLMQMAQTRGIPVLGLETMQSQFELFEKMKDADIRALLLDAVYPGPETNERNLQMIENYKTQNIDGIYEAMRESAELKNHEKELLTDRNVAWVKKLPSMMKASQCFIALGAAHLPGANGVLQLLRKGGYKVEAVTK